MARWTETINGTVYYHCDIWVGILGRGSRRIYLSHTGTRTTKDSRRFPKLKDSVWSSIWRNEVAPLCSLPLTLHSDGHGMYRQKLGYNHKYVVHTRKNFWDWGQKTKVQGGTLCIDSVWKQLRIKGGLQHMNHDGYDVAYPRAAAWLHMQNGYLCDTIRELICVLTRRVVPGK